MSIFEHHIAFKHFEDRKEDSESESDTESETEETTEEPTKEPTEEPTEEPTSIQPANIEMIMDQIEDDEDDDEADQEENDVKNKEEEEKERPKPLTHSYCHWGYEQDPYCLLCNNDKPNELYSTNCNRKYGGYIALCKKCIESGKVEKQTQIIDRIGFDIKDKPRIWPCCWCDVLLGAGYSWHTFNGKTDWMNNIYDICNSCFGRSVELAQKRGTILQETPSLFFRYGDRSGDDYKWPMRDPTTFSYVIPESLVDNHDNKPCINASLAESYVKYWDCLIHAMTDGYFYFQEWTLITDFVDVDSFPAMTALAVRCVSDKPHQVASLVMDDHGRVSIDIIYENLDDFWKEYNEFVEMRNSLTKEEKQRRFDIVKNTFDDDRSCKESVMMDGTNDFSTYIRLKRCDQYPGDYEFYYG